MKQSAEGGGVELRVLAVLPDENPQPWKRPPTGAQCVVYRLQVHSIDGKMHDLRPDDFRVGSATPFDAVGRCFSAQLEPTWVGSGFRMVSVTVVEPDGPPGTLMWQTA